MNILFDNDNFFWLMIALVSAGAWTIVSWRRTEAWSRVAVASVDAHNQELERLHESLRSGRIDDDDFVEMRDDLLEKLAELTETDD